MDKQPYQNKLDKSVNKDKAKKPTAYDILEDATKQLEKQNREKEFDKKIGIKHATVSEVKEANDFTVPKEYIDKHED